MLALHKVLPALDHHVNALGIHLHAQYQATGFVAGNERDARADKQIYLRDARLEFV